MTAREGLVPVVLSEGGPVTSEEEADRLGLGRAYRALRVNERLTDPGAILEIVNTAEAEGRALTVEEYERITGHHDPCDLSAWLQGLISEWESRGAHAGSAERLYGERYAQELRDLLANNLGRQ